VIAKLSQSRTTTFVGSLSGVGAIALVLLPQDIRDGCVSAISNSNNPLVLGGLVAVAIVGGYMGPSLTDKNGTKNPNSEETNSGPNPS